MKKKLFSAALCGVFVILLMPFKGESRVDEKWCDAKGDMYFIGGQSTFVCPAQGNVSCRYKCAA